MLAQFCFEWFFVPGRFAEELDRVSAEPTLAARIGELRELELKGLSGTHVVRAVTWECAR